MLRPTGIILIMIILFTHVGCWDVQDVADSAFVTAIGLDVSDKPGMIKVTFVIPKPSIIRVRSDKESTINLPVEAESINRAIEKLGTRLSRNVRFGHLRVIVIGEKLAMKNLRKYTDFFSKNPEVALRTRLMFVQSGEAKEVFTIPPILTRSTVGEIVGLTMAGKKNALERTISLQDLRKELLRSNGTVLASRIRINKDNGKPFIEHEGGAVLKEWRVIGWLDENEMKYANLFFCKPKPIVTGNIGGNQYTFSIDRKSVNIIPKIKGDRVSFLVELNASGNILEEQFGQDLSNPENLKKIQKLLLRTMTNQVINAIYKSQDLNADYLGFGKALEIKNSKLYRKLDWAKLYPNAPVTVQVQTNVHRFGKTK